MRWVALWVLVACSSRDRAPERAPEPTRDTATVRVAQDAGTTGRIARAAEQPPAPMTVRWRSVERTEDCWFFSGPDGRDDQLRGAVVVETVERQGDLLTLRIGTAVFEGTYADGELSLARQSTYDHEGPWRVTESIRGRLAGGQLVARYAYEECELSGACPGPCRITGELMFSRAF